ncbi:MAG: hypothetical protein KatS3mg131_2764 [Candidatus Tectimicrobiota bacterium]|nr:MAG: hypothetical protein KatS3mg131_2764 [Candidatus Tectomicrobia bacterium]
MSATAQLAQFIAAAGEAPLPAPVVAAAKVAILDGVASLLAGATQPVAALVSRYVRAMGGEAVCRVAGQDYRTSPAFAAFANGVFLHCLDFEIQGDPPTHGTSAVLPAALALGEWQGASGRRLIAAYVVGWEVQARLRRATAHAELRGFHPPGLFGPLGAAAASAVMLGLEAPQVRMALGIAASHTGGLTANTGTMVKATHPGAAARTGVEAALLAREGFISHQAILEAPQGYIETLFGGACNWEELTRGLGTTFGLVDPGFIIKRYPAHIALQWPIEAVRMLRQRYGLHLDEVETLEVEVPAARAAYLRPVPASGLEGKFSFAYGAAVALVREEVDIDAFSDAVYASPAVQAALRKVRVRPNPAIPADLRRTWAVARAKTTDGRALSYTCHRFPGAFGEPLPRPEHHAKFRACAGRLLAPAQVAQLLATLEALEELPDLRALGALLAPGA